MLKIRGILTQTVIATPFALLIPLSFSRLLSWAIDTNNSGGGLFYFPSTPLEFLFALGLLGSALPFFVTVFTLIFPLAAITQALGLQFIGVVPLLGLAPTLDAPFTIAVGIGIAIQIVTWSVAVRLLLGRIRKHTALEIWKNH